MLGGEYISSIESADSVQVFLLNGWQKGDSSNYLSTFLILQEAQELDSLQEAKAKWLLMTKDSYIIDGWAKSCEFIPQIGFVFHQDTSQKEVLLSFACDVAKFYEQGQVKAVLNMDVGRSRLLGFAQSLFPDTINVAHPCNRPELQDPFEILDPEPPVDSSTSDTIASPENQVVTSDSTISPVARTESTHPTPSLDAPNEESPTPIAFVTKKVKKKSTLADFATKYNLSEEVLKQYNNLTSSDISNLRTIKIPVYKDSSQPNEE